MQYLDSRARNNVCEYKDKFLKFDEKVKDAFFFCFFVGDLLKIHIKGKDTILISSKDDNYKMILDVLLCVKTKKWANTLKKFWDSCEK